MYQQITSNKRKTVLLVVIFILIVLGLGWVFGEYSGKDSGYIGLILAAIIATLMTLLSYFKGDKVALAASGAKAIKKDDNAYLYRMVENLAITAGLPTPKVHIINDPAINAFATGRDPNHASIAVTTGAIEKLKNEELEGVIAHELAHIKNYDIRLMTVVIVLVGVIVLLSDWMMRMNLYGGGRRSNNRQGGGIIVIIAIAAMIVAPILARLIKLAISRKREYLADASGALLTRFPAGLANALEKIGEETKPLVRANHATAHLYISNPFGARSKKLTAKLFSTHPPLEERINALRSMSR